MSAKIRIIIGFAVIRHGFLITCMKYDDKFHVSVAFAKE